MSKKKTATIHISPELEIFLRSKRALVKFRKEVTDLSVWVGRNKNNPLGSISQAFWWEGSTDGKEFWEKLSDEYDEKLS